MPASSRGSSNRSNTAALSAMCPPDEPPLATILPGSTASSLTCARTHQIADLASAIAFEGCGPVTLEDPIVGNDRHHAACGRMPSRRDELRDLSAHPAAAKEEHDRGPRIRTVTRWRKDVQSQLGPVDLLVDVVDRPRDSAHQRLRRGTSMHTHTKSARDENRRCDDSDAEMRNDACSNCHSPPLIQLAECQDRTYHRPTGAGRLRIPRASSERRRPAHDGRSHH